jgi:hypothetical protein
VLYQVVRIQPSKTSSACAGVEYSGRPLRIERGYDLHQTLLVNYRGVAFFADMVQSESTGASTATSNSGTRRPSSRRQSLLASEASSQDAARDDR